MDVLGLRWFVLVVYLEYFWSVGVVRVVKFLTGVGLWGDFSKVRDYLG